MPQNVTTDTKYNINPKCNMNPNQKLLHFVSQVVTFWFNVTFCINCYISRHNSSQLVKTRKLTLCSVSLMWLPGGLVLLSTCDLSASCPFSVFLLMLTGACGLAKLSLACFPCVLVVFGFSPNLASPSPFRRNVFWALGALSPLTDVLSLNIINKPFVYSLK